MWIFGYGSIIWKPNFVYQDRQIARLDGWMRRFYQGSPDHRGVPGRPGRVVTLLEHEHENTWGMAYELDPKEAARVLGELDVREQGGYERSILPVFLKPSSRTVQAWVYRATPENEHYLGPAPLHEMVEQILSSHGPSGANVEYVLKLAEAFKELELEDEHIFELAHALQNEMRLHGDDE